ncbi:MAG: hypothetical protein IJ168_01825 [Eubacterium sp.]|nr:hypothetical protein [Eubacterium sp.]
MKKIIRALCVILTLALTLSTTAIAFAKEAVTPVICVHGLGMSPLYTDVGTDAEAQMRAYGIDVSSLLGNETIRNEFLKMLDPARQKEVDEDKLFNAMGDYFRETPLNCDEDGNVPEGTGNNNYFEDSMVKHQDYMDQRDHSEEAIVKTIADRIGAKNVYAFNYDWRVDLVETAANLAHFVDVVKAETGAKKVVLVGSSLGGAILNCYMDAYKSRNDVARYIFVNPAIMGVEVASMYAYDVEINKADLLAFAKIMETEFSGGSQSTLINLAGNIGEYRIGYLANYLSALAEDEERVTKLFHLALKDWIGNIPAYWECIPYDRFDECVNNMVRIGFLDKSSGLYKKITNYHKVQGRLASNLKAVKAQGAEVAIFACYGSPGIPVTSHIMEQTDVLIDTKYASGGATVAPFGYYLTGSDAKGSYVSPDGVINASTCVTPDNVWFIRDIQHMQFNYGGDAINLIAYLAAGECSCDIASVKSKYGWNQFLRADSSQKLINITAADKPQITGKNWEKKSGKWFYYKNGVMTTGWQKVDGKWYFMNFIGEMQTGWQMIRGKWYYLGADGAMRTGWQKIGKYWYYLKADGAMATGWLKDGGKWYYLNDTGEMRASQWLQYKGQWYYFNQNGTMRTEALKYKNNWYYFTADGAMKTSTWVKDGDNWYYVNADGKMRYGCWLKDGGKWYYFNQNGTMRTSYLDYQGKRYYFNTNGACTNP